MEASKKIDASSELSEVSIHTLHELEASTVLDIAGYEILLVSIHTLHELEASGITIYVADATGKFPFIRFTNWKQD